MMKLFAQCNSPSDSPFGCISPPTSTINDITDPNLGIVAFANRILALVIVGAGIYAFINIIAAGYGFLGAGGDAKKVQQSWDKIWQSLLGVLFVAGSFVLAAIFGWIFFKDPTAILNPRIITPTP